MASLTSNSSDTIVTFNKDLGLDGLITCFKQAGPIIMVQITAESLTTQTAKLTFKNNQDAEVAEQYKDLWLLENSLDIKPTSERISNSPPPRPMSQVHVVKRKRQRSPEPTQVPEKTRLFCQIPWSRIEGNKDLTTTEKEREEVFFNHFAQFGIMEYYHTIRDRQDRLSHGFVKYHHE